MTKHLWTAALALWVAPGVYAQATATANVSVGAEAGLTVVATPNMTSSGANFAYMSTTTNLTYFIRTSQGGSGNIVLQVTSDFSPTGGPSVASPPSVQDKLTYTCNAANPGNNGTAAPCSGSMTASTTNATSVASFGSDARSLMSGNSASVSWILTNDPTYKVGSYQATITFTISAI